MRLREVRERNNLTRKQMAKIIEENGYHCTYGAIRDIEYGDYNPSYNFMLAFYKAFPEYTIDEIFFDDLS